MIAQAFCFKRLNYISLVADEISYRLLQIIATANDCETSCEQHNERSKHSNSAS